MLSLRKLAHHITSGKFSLRWMVLLPHQLYTQNNFQHPNLVPSSKFIHPSQSFSTTLLVQARDTGKLSMDLEAAIDSNKFIDAWKLHEQHMQMEGFPRKYIVNKVIARFAETLDVEWLNKAYGLVERAFQEGKQNLLEKDSLIYLALCLARSGLPVPASTVVRMLFKREEFPTVAAWSAILAQLSQTAPGAYLAAELVLEISYIFQDGRIDPRKKINKPLLDTKPNTTAFNVALAGCTLFGTTRKAEQLLDMMPRIGVKADGPLLIIMAQIYEKNGRKEELRKLKRHIDEAHDLSAVQFQQYYNCLLSCLLKFGDLESASNMVLEMLYKAKEVQNTLAIAKLAFPSKPPDMRKSKLDENPLLSFDDFCADGSCLKLEAEVKIVLSELLSKLKNQVELITTERGILQPTEKILVKMAKAFLESRKVKELAEFLIKAEKAGSPVSVDSSPLVHVINTCISLGWLDEAHDLLDEMRFAGIRTGSSVYGSLLKAYCKANRPKEITSLLKEVRKAGIQLDSSCYESLIQSKVLHNDNQAALNIFQEMKESKIPRSIRTKTESEDGNGMMGKLLEEIKEGQTVDSGVHDWNNVIHFFCKKQMMGDAEKALKKMRSLGHLPNAQTFHSMVTGYAAIGGKYTEVTELWGEMKSFSGATGMKFDQELLDSVLYTFVRGGFFVRGKEVVEMMEKGKMFIDMYKYRSLMMKYHKTMYKGKAPKFQTEAQNTKREAALAFKKWVGLC
ncbi:pentatricopeptide repeat-containing protein At1g03100, mitochondrial [Impatiens glandulifera]|uniref:pentatricopeptide repeat-containing protein At1g03100, mitochondrial n=1 Tax=Impatiens glandulifera TaxID=253017 RepID=UPI001FB0C409|nr:pentatricopeptide repeat-containing protein At1g03100, mitochondrial [Impatiens glandulifera]